MTSLSIWKINTKGWFADMNSFNTIALGVYYMSDTMLDTEGTMINKIFTKRSHGLYAYLYVYLPTIVHVRRRD